ncbi:MAG: hypothetical protein JWQ50_9009 [Caballeronia mineralivorans]|nr:hypothetical protein [Caballeronia mineralivorans]
MRGGWYRELVATASWRLKPIVRETRHVPRDHALVGAADSLHDTFDEVHLDLEGAAVRAALVRPVKDMAVGQYARRAVFEVDDDKVRRVSKELAPQKSETPNKAGF